MNYVWHQRAMLHELMYVCIYNQIDKTISTDYYKSLENNATLINHEAK